MVGASIIDKHPVHLRGAPGCGQDGKGDSIIGFDEDLINLGGAQDGTTVGTVVEQPDEWGDQDDKDLAKNLEGEAVHPASS